MPKILEQFDIADPDSYVFGCVTSIPTVNNYTVTTISGISVTIQDTQETYGIGDQVVLATQRQDLTSAFILKKVDNMFPSAVNFVIDDGEG